MSKIAKSIYGKIAFSISSRWKENRSLPNVLNWMRRNFENIKTQKIVPLLNEDDKSKSKDENAEKRLTGFAVLRMVEYLLGNNFKTCIELWNPKHKRKRRLLGTKQLNALSKGEASGYNSGGVSPYTLSVIAIAIGQRYTKAHGTTWNVKEIDSKELFDIAKKYHAEKKAEREARAKAKPKNNKVKAKSKAKPNASGSSETASKEIVSESTVENYLNGDLELSKIEDTELLKQFHEDERVTRGKKSAITRRINVLSAS